MRPARAVLGLLAGLLIMVAPAAADAAQGGPGGSQGGGEKKAAEPAAAAPAKEDLYLLGDSEPSGSMTTSSPPGGPLPNFDQNRDSEPGLLLERSGKGANETKATRYQEWRFDVSGQTVSVQTLRIWAAAKDFDTAGSVVLGAYLLDCGSGCTVLDSATATTRSTKDWKQLNLPLVVNNHEFGTGHELVVKVVADDGSDGDVWLAYGTTTYDAHLQTTVQATPPTTTTSTVPIETTTTAEAVTTTEASGGGDTTTTEDDQDLVAAPVTTSPGATGGTGNTAPTSQRGDATTVSTPRLFEPRRQVLVLDAVGTGGLDVFRTARELEPAEGLGVVFATVAENINLYWQAAVATGSVASILLWLGLSRRDES